VIQGTVLMRSTKRTVNMLDAVQELTCEMGAPEGTAFVEFIKHDDWSFVIEMHVLVEGAVCHALAAKCGIKDAEVFAGIPIGNKRRGLRALVEKLKLLNPGQLNFIQRLAELRNRFAHDIHWLKRSIADYLHEMQPDERTTFIRDMCMGSGISEPRRQDIFVEFVSKRPETVKAIIFVAVCVILLRAHKYRAWRKRARELSKRLAQALAVK